MEEQFVLRVPPSVAEKINKLLSENGSSFEDNLLDLSFSEDRRSGTFAIGNERFPAALLDLPTVVESYKTYDDCAIVKTADIGQIIMVREGGDIAPDVLEYKHGITPPMRDARKRRFRREPDLNPELVQRVEKDLLNIMSGGTVEADIEANDQEEGDANARKATRNIPSKPAAKRNVPESVPNNEDPDGSDPEESDTSESDPCGLIQSFT